MGSETTAAATGQQGVVRRDPFAMLPFTGYNMADYFNHWLQMGENLGKKPRRQATSCQKCSKSTGSAVIQMVTLYGLVLVQNMRVLQWIIERCEGTANAVRTPIGLVPTYDDINWDQSDFTKAQYELVTSQDKDAWIKELESHAELLTSWVSVCQQHSKHIMPNFKADIEQA